MSKSERTCLIEGCEKPHRAKGWCASHYNQVWKSGVPSPTAMVSAGPLKALFDSPAEMALRLDMSSREAFRCFQDGHKIPWYTADKHAIQMGLHPLNVWGDEWLLDVSGDCGVDW